jgi:hypothetical protein
LLHRTKSSRRSRLSITEITTMNRERGAKHVPTGEQNGAADCLGGQTPGRVAPVGHALGRFLAGRWMRFHSLPRSTLAWKNAKGNLEAMHVQGGERIR